MSDYGLSLRRRKRASAAAAARSRAVARRRASGAGAGAGAVTPAMGPRAGLASSRSVNPYVVHKFRRWTENDVTVDLTGGATFASFGVTFRLSFLQNSAELTDLYDQYRIDKVRCYLTWEAPVGAATTTSLVAAAPTALILRDFDSAAAPTLAELKQASRTWQHKMDPMRDLVFDIVPVYNTDTVVVARTPKIIDMAAPAVDHYGLKIGVQYPDVGTTAHNGRLRLRLQYFISCFNPR